MTTWVPQTPQSEGWSGASPSSSTWSPQVPQTEGWGDNSLWLLSGGYWDDLGQWDDLASWRDGALWQGQANQSETWT